jgi:pimeloyl-ACP methyl ester carboxylesterase
MAPKSWRVCANSASSDASMATFVLVHGAWHGAWCWRDLLPLLQQKGHRVHAPTLTGLGDRAHLLSSNIQLQTHIDDVWMTLETEELFDVVLVVHSYAGMLGTAVADKAPERLRHLVYLDAVVPKPGESWSGVHSRSTRDARMASAKAHPHFAFAPPPALAYGIEGEAAQWLERRQSPHPAGTYDAPLRFDPLRVASVRRTFISCTQPALVTIDPMRKRVQDPGFWDGHWLPQSALLEMKTGHDPMISAPQALAEVLVACAQA